MTCWQGWKPRGSCSMWSPSLPLSWSYTELYKEDKQVWHGTAKSKWCLKKLFYNSLLLRNKTWLWSGGFTACFCVICNCYCWTAVRCLSWNWIWIWLSHWACLLNYFMVAQIPNFLCRERFVTAWHVALHSLAFRDFYFALLLGDQKCNFSNFESCGL